MTNQETSEHLVKDSDSNFSMKFVWGFLVFHRRFFLGAILLAGVLYFVWELSKRESPPLTRPVVSNPGPVAPEIVIGTELKKSDDDSTSSTVEELIDQAIEAWAGWPLRSDGDAVDSIQRNTQRLAGLLKRPLSDTQREFCTSAYMDNVGMLVHIKSLFKQIDDPAIEQQQDKAIEEIDRLYGTHENPLYAAKANLAYMRKAGAEFIAGQRSFVRLIQELENRQQWIWPIKVTRVDLCELLIAIHRQSQHSSETRVLPLIALRKAATWGEDAHLIMFRIANEIYFKGKCNLKDIPTRVLNNRPDSDEEIRLLFEAISEFPDYPVRFYSLAATCIHALQKNGRRVRANFYLQELRDVAPKVTNATIQEEVKKAIQMLEEVAEQIDQPGTANPATSPSPDAS